MNKKLIFMVGAILMIVGLLLMLTCSTCSAQDEEPIEDPDEIDEDKSIWEKIFPGLYGAGLSSLACLAYYIGFFIIMGGFMLVIFPSIAGGPLVIIVLAASVIVAIYYIFWVIPPECKAF